MTVRDEYNPQSAGGLPVAERHWPDRPPEANLNLLPRLRSSAPQVNTQVDRTPVASGLAALPLECARKSCGACQEAHAGFSFTMAFQPIVDLQEGRIAAYEALVRGLDGSGAAQVLAQVNAQNLYAFDQACRVKAIELAVHLKLDGQLNINFFPNAVYEPRACIQATLQAAARTGFDPRRLTFEIVETEQIADTPHLLRIITEYRRQGFKIALDDFGTGYSGLSRLAELKPDILKLDRALVKDCDRDRARLAIVASMIALGAEIGIKVVVEGVERREEANALQAIGARYLQGFYFARPGFKKVDYRTEISWPTSSDP